MATITLYLVRHGEAENNVRQILNSMPLRHEYALTARGREQVARTATYLATVQADVLLCSPILRAKQTAGMISEATGLPVLLDDRLREVGMGRFNEHQRQELLDKYPRPEMRLSPDPLDGTESILGVRKRLNAVLDDIKKKYVGKKVIIVSHGDPLEQLHGIVMHEGPGKAALGWYPQKGSYTEVVWEV